MSRAESLKPEEAGEREEAGGRRVGERVAQLRGAMKISQRNLDRRAGLSHGYTSKLEAGQVPNPGLLQLQRIAEALSMPVAELLADEDDAVAKRVSEVQQVTARAEGSATSRADLEALQAGIRAIWRSDPQRVAALSVLVRDMEKQVDVERRDKS
ncbi:MAG: helix-turn-helix domain-containing protein [Chloroflexota bacterium]|nr:helix-turn-helix domain-containing protein [Chloroflexota bacterium]